MTEQIFPTEEHRATLLGALKLLGVQTVNVSFSGGGDSGSIDDITARDAAMNPVNLTTHELTWVATSSHYSSSGWVTNSSDVIEPIRDIVERVAYAALEKSGLDWYNNDGGQGEFTIDLSVSPPEITLNVGVNYTQTDEHVFNFSGIKDGIEGDEACTPTTTA